MEKKNVLLSVKDLEVKFRVRGRILSAIRGVSLDIYEDESIAIVGESGAGKSVFTKAFAGMLDSNGFVSNGSILFNDPELSDTVVKLNSTAWKFINSYKKQLDENSKLELGAATYRKMLELDSEKREKSTLSAADREKEEKELHALKVKRTEAFNMKQTLDPSKEKAKIKETAAEIKKLDAEIKALEKATEQKIKEHKNSVAHDTAYQKSYQDRMEQLKKQYAEETSKEISDSTRKRNEILAKEVYLSVGRYNFKKRFKMGRGLIGELKKAMQMGVDLNSDEERNKVFGNVTFRVRYLDETSEQLHGTCIINLAQVKDQNDWGQIRGKKLRFSRTR